MATTQEKLRSDTSAALKAGDKIRVSTLRMVSAKLQEAEIQQGAAWGEDKVADVIARYAKQLRESMEGFAQGGRDDRKQQTERELAIVEEYLPKQLSDEELTAIVKETLAETGVQSAKEFGRLMGALMPKVKGRADGKKVQQIAKGLLGA